MIRAKDPSIMFLTETWADETRLQEIKHKIEFDNLFFVERNNRGGGLALYWRNSIDVHVDTFSKNHIDSIINKGGEDEWHFTQASTENQFPTKDLNHGISSDNSRESLISLGCVLETLMKFLEVQKNWEVIIEVKHKCSYSGMWWMNVVLLILDS